ncbi:haloacid dehalogenase [Salegentibacter salinarum]|uniref:phosphoglycolate phosphatase n=1 Tax=Salegentibacter salinarum TaxID=447422 RepID=A0A2N0TPU3_9FLAO|nr:HAD-IA family hydrolase [Salegentibacter salinarum]PKD16757.1 haloacid dehalogenase [Salegentibacter salinarum]SKB59498.1 haloacid dehalogenase superfamily, subfamily IA, variant 1 with third motif having Dx(3-4)D or Dx(3-4)E [Salegentibacter salinarum]
MIQLKNKKNILWDFDGVIMDSMPVRNKGFELVLKDYPQEQVQELMKFHLKNGGLSRYVKFRYFFEEIRKEKISEEEVTVWASRFSEVMKRELLNKKLLIEDTCNFIKRNYNNFEMHIVSGSDQEELRFLCKKLKLDSFFISINGSPTPKKKLVEELLMEFRYKTDETALIGDSINDYEAAVASDIDFLGYNNPSIQDKGRSYINSFSVL